MNGYWDYNAKWNKSNEKGQEPYGFKHMWHIKQQVTNEQAKRANN